MVCYDLPYPFPLSEARPTVDAWSLALVLAPPEFETAVARLTLTDGAASAADDAADTTLANPQLESIRLGNPTARMLPLFAALAQPGASDSRAASRQRPRVAGGDVGMLMPSIETLLPHAGRMRLIDRVVSYDEQTIVCESDSHRAADHPLAEAGVLSIICGLEYGAQAMAIHGALLAAWRITRCRHASRLSGRCVRPAVDR